MVKDGEGSFSLRVGSKEQDKNVDFAQSLDSPEQDVACGYPFHSSLVRNSRVPGVNLD